MSEIAVALDFPSPVPALELVGRLGSDADFYKVGLELFTCAGPSFLEELRAAGKRIFLDLKLHDIPNTVRGAAAAARELGVELITVHATGGTRMIAAAAEGAGGDVRVVAITLLTSLSAMEVREVWGRRELSEDGEVVRLARLAQLAGAAGVVASPREARALRSVLGPEALIVTPGIRPRGAEMHDQARVATPADAVAAGADVLVVGRSITMADDPAEAFRRIRSEMESP